MKTQSSIARYREERGGGREGGREGEREGGREGGREEGGREGELRLQARDIITNELSTSRHNISVDQLHFSYILYVLFHLLKT